MQRLRLLSLLRRPAGPLSCKNACRLSTPRSLSTLPNLPLFHALRNHRHDAPAVVHSASARSFTYGNLVADVLEAKEKLARTAGRSAVSGERVAFLAENSYDYVGTVLFASCV